MFEAAYVGTLRNGTLQEKIDRAYGLLKDCTACPRKCRVNRLDGETGFWQVAAKGTVSSANPHFGEERPLVGTGGSGTIFFTSCNLKCVFCQNYEISHLMEGQELETETLGELMLGLQRLGCHNINLVTPSHVVPQILAAVEYAASFGLQVPLVFNSGGYDTLETLRILDGVVDIYMPDLKSMDSRVCKELMDAPDYPEVVRAAIIEMHRQVGDLQINERGIATRGLLVRHLVMPDDLASTREAMRFLAREVSKNTYVNIMNQYRPCGRSYEHPPLDRSVNRTEYLRAVEVAGEEGIERLDDRVAVRLKFP
jgi:putative pyruvate formate lyase activating enzyme